MSGFQVHMHTRPGPPPQLQFHTPTPQHNRVRCMVYGTVYTTHGRGQVLCNANTVCDAGGRLTNKFAAKYAVSVRPYGALLKSNGVPYRHTYMPGNVTAVHDGVA